MRSKKFVVCCNEADNFLKEGVTNAKVSIDEIINLYVVYVM